MKIGLRVILNVLLIAEFFIPIHAARASDGYCEVQGVEADIRQSGHRGQLVVEVLEIDFAGAVQNVDAGEAYLNWVSEEYLMDAALDYSDAELAKQYGVRVIGGGMPYITTRATAAYWIDGSTLILLFITKDIYNNNPVGRVSQHSMDVAQLYSESRSTNLLHVLNQAEYLDASWSKKRPQTLSCQLFTSVG